MRNIKKILIGILALTLCLTMLSGCGVNKSPKSVAKAYISATSNMSFDGMLKCYDTKDLSSTEKEAAKAIFNLAMDNITDEQKAQVKSMKFKSYEKLDGTDTTEKGKITFTYKENGKGDAKEQTTELDFTKSGGNWYIAGNFDFL